MFSDHNWAADVVKGYVLPVFISIFQRLHALLPVIPTEDLKYASHSLQVETHNSDYKFQLYVE
jgi:hypothetical protein